MCYARIGMDVLCLGICTVPPTEFSAALITKIERQHELDGELTPACVNLTIFPDGAAPLVKRAVMLYDTRAKALAAQRRLRTGTDPSPVVAFYGE